MASGDSGSPDVELVYFKRCTEKLMSASTSPAKKLDLLKRLRQVKVNMQVLAGSGIGKAVNACRDGSRSELDSVATELVNHWKRVVDSTLNQRPELLNQPLPSVPDVSKAVAAEHKSKSSPASGSHVAPTDSKKSGLDSTKSQADSKKVELNLKQANPISKKSASDSKASDPCPIKSVDYSDKQDESKRISKKDEKTIQPKSASKQESPTTKVRSEAKPNVSFNLPAPDSSINDTADFNSLNKDSKPSKKKLAKSSLEEFDNTTGFSFEDCLDLAASQRTNKQKKKKKKVGPKEEQKETIKKELPKLPSDLNLGVSEDPALVLSGTSKRRKDDEDDDLAMPLKLHTRTAVYSGRSRQFYDQVPTLKQTCLDYLAGHVDWLGAMGEGVPYHVIKPVLAKCNVDQLERLEACNPHLIGDDDELWQLHFMRDFPDQNTDQSLDEDAGRSGSAPWRRRYFRSRRKQQAKLRSITERLANSQAQARSQQRKTMLTLIDKPPHRKRQRHNDDSISAPSLKLTTMNKAAQKSANPERARLVEKLSEHILPTASAPMSVHSTPQLAPTAGGHGGGTRRGAKSAPLMSKTLKQVKKLKANGYYRV